MNSMDVFISIWNAAWRISHHRNFSILSISARSKMSFFYTITALRSLRCVVEENKKFKVNSMNFVRRFLISASCQGLFISRSCFVLPGNFLSCLFHALRKRRKKFSNFKQFSLIILFNHVTRAWKFIAHVSQFLVEPETNELIQNNALIIIWIMKLPFIVFIFLSFTSKDKRNWGIKTNKRSWAQQWRQ